MEGKNNVIEDETGVHTSKKLTAECCCGASKLRLGKGAHQVLVLMLEKSVPGGGGAHLESQHLEDIGKQISEFGPA